MGFKIIYEAGTYVCYVIDQKNLRRLKVYYTSGNFAALKQRVLEWYSTNKRE